MNTGYRLSLSLLVVAAILSASQAWCQQLTVSVTVSNAAGDHIDGLVVSAFGDTDIWVEDVTDALGSVTLTLPRPGEHDSVVVGLFPPTLDMQGMTVYRQWEQRRVELLNQYAADGLYTVPLIEGVSEYDVSITLHEAVAISGTVKIEGTPAPVSVALVGALWGSMSDRATGFFTVGGIRKGSAAALLFVRGYGQRELHWFTDVETLDDIDLGDVPLAPAESDCQLNLDVMDWEQLDLRGRSRIPSVSLVRDDGSYAISLNLDAVGRAQLFRALPAELWIPAGTYYVATGPGGPDPVANRLIRLVHEGVVDLDAAGVAKVTVIAGQVTTLQLSAPVVEAAVMNAGE